MSILFKLSSNRVIAVLAFLALVLGVFLTVQTVQAAPAEKPIFLTKSGQKAGNFSLRQIPGFNVAGIDNPGYNGSYVMRPDQLPNVAFWFLVCQGKCPPYQVGTSPTVSGLKLYPVVIQGVLVPQPKANPNLASMVLLNGTKCPLLVNQSTSVMQKAWNCLTAEIKRQATPALNANGIN